MVWCQYESNQKNFTGKSKESAACRGLQSNRNRRPDRLSVYNRKIRMPQTENPYLYIVLDGTLRLYTPSGIMDYMAGQYSVSKIDTPLSGTVLAFSKQQDFLALAVAFTPNDVIA